MARSNKAFTIELSTKFESYRKVRKPMPPAGKFHSTKKGAKGYDRRRDKREFFHNQEEGA